jgi:hypothetical protein
MPPPCFSKKAKLIGNVRNFIKLWNLCQEEISEYFWEEAKRVNGEKQAITFK